MSAGRPGGTTRSRRCARDDAKLYVTFTSLSFRAGLPAIARNNGYVIQRLWL